MFYKVHLPDEDNPGQPNIADLDPFSAIPYVVASVGAWLETAPEDPDDEDAVLAWHQSRPLIATDDQIWAMECSVNLTRMGAVIVGRRILDLNATVDRMIEEGRALSIQEESEKIFGMRGAAVDGSGFIASDQDGPHGPGCRCPHPTEDGQRKQAGIPENYSPVAEMETFLSAMTNGL